MLEVRDLKLLLSQQDVGFTLPAASMTNRDGHGSHGSVDSSVHQKFIEISIKFNSQVIVKHIHS